MTSIGRTALLVPCYNASRFLPRLRAQIDRLNPRFEQVLLVDDASQDDTAAQAAALGFEILKLPANRGPGGARNALARATKAEWIHFHDVDDEIAPEYLTLVAPAVRAECDAVLHYTDFIDERTRAPIIRWAFDPDELRRDPARTLLARPMPTMSSFLRRDAFWRINGFDEERRCFEDGDLHFRLAAAGMRITPLPQVLEWSLRHDEGAGADQHYCARCRLHFLQTYAREHPALAATIAAETERTAVQLLRFNDGPNVRAAIQLCQRLGHPVPTTSHLVMKIARTFVPASRLLRWQQQWRAHH